MKVISNTVEQKLKGLSLKTDNLLSEESLNLLAKSKTTKNKKFNQQNYDKIVSQLPPRIYVSLLDVLEVIQNNLKVTSEDSTKYSIWTREHASLRPCKSVSYKTGNVITQRDAEIEQILLTLDKKEKRSVIIVGEPGVGKTAVVRAVNARLIERTVPRNLISCEIFNLDLPYIFSKHKEDPIGIIIKILETASNDDKCILFIDEVHQLLTQKMNDVLKPYLTERIRFIGSTTIDEYHSIVTDDRALERRFTIVPIEEPNIIQTSKMIIGTKSVFEDHHRCHIPDDSCTYLVENGSRFLGHRRNPDKSLDIMDIACTLLHHNEVHQTSIRPDPTGDVLTDLDLDLKEIASTKTNAGTRILTEEYVNKAISHITGVDYNTIRNSLDYEFVANTIKSKVFGQDAAIEELSNIVNIIKNINYDQGRPLSIILLAGPAGCGKLSACKELANLVFGSETNLIDVDLGSFKSEFQLTELRGAPPGYVGYGKSGILIKQLRNKPQSVVFFRKSNQCHPTILDYLLGGINKGRFVDSAEREVKLNNAIIVFSVTMSEEELKNINKKAIGFVVDVKKEQGEVSNEDIEKALGSTGSELKRAADSFVSFNKLDNKLLNQIFDVNVDRYLEMYKKVDLNKAELKEKVLKDSTNGHDIIAKLSSEVPKLIFKSLKGE